MPGAPGREEYRIPLPAGNGAPVAPPTFGSMTYQPGDKSLSASGGSRHARYRLKDLCVHEMPEDLASGDCGSRIGRILIWARQVLLLEIMNAITASLECPEQKWSRRKPFVERWPNGGDSNARAATARIGRKTCPRFRRAILFSRLTVSKSLRWTERKAPRIP